MDRHQSAVQHVRVNHPLALPDTSLQHPRLVVRAVRHRNQLPEPALPRKPGLEIYLPARSIVQLPRYDIDYPVGHPQRLVKLLRIAEHPLHFDLALLWAAHNELLDFLELVDSEQSVDVFPVGPCLPSETARVARHLLGQLPRLKGLASVVACQGLLTCRDQAEFVLPETVHVRLYRLELATVPQHRLQDQRWGLVARERLPLEEVQAVLSQPES